jgi:antitoxin component of MazEF toxin-antitoxin module
MVGLEVRKFGNSLGVVLPKQAIARLDTRDGAVLHLTEAPDGGDRLVSFDPAFEKKMALAAGAMDESDHAAFLAANTRARKRRR